MRRYAALILVVTLALWGCKKKQAVPYEGTTLYLASNEGGNWDIYTLKIGDENPQKVIGTSADEKHPFVSGDKIYFAANDDGDYDVYSANLDGSGRTKVTDLPGDEFEPSVSPDGRYLAFTWSGYGGGWVVVLYDLQNGDTLRTFGDPSMTNISPFFVGNDTLIMTLQDYNGVYSQDPWIYVISSDTLINIKATSSYQEGDWRVMNGKVVFSRMTIYGEDKHIVVADFPSFNNESRLYSAPGEYPRSPTFAPDGGAAAIGHSDKCLIVSVDLSDKKVDTLYLRDGAECYARSWK